MIQTPGGYYIARNATLTGDLTIGPKASFWFNAVVRGDVAAITIGPRTNVQDNAVIHCDTGFPNVIEEDVVIGHSAIVHGVFVGAGSLIGMGSTLLGRTKVGRQCLIGAGSVVPPGMEIPDRSLVMGVPAKIIRPVNDTDLQMMTWLAAHYVELAEKHIRGEIVDHMAALNPSTQPQPSL